MHIGWLSLLAQFLNSSVWFSYGILTKDLNLLMPYAYGIFTDVCVVVGILIIKTKQLHRSTKRIDIH
jgi:hypothetical protein